MRRFLAAWPVIVPVVAAAAFHTPGFGGFWLGDDWSNLGRAYQAANAGSLWSETWGEFIAPNLGESSFLRPMLIASFSLNYQLSGTSYAGWYAFNFAVHLVNVALVAFLVSSWARKLGCDGKLTACLAALVFGLSPLLAEGVFWVSARSDGWVTLCSLAGIAVWMRDSDRGSRHGALVYPALLAIGLGFKESAAILPFQMALVAWGWPGPRPRGMLFGVVAAFAVLGLYFVFRSMLFSSMFETYIGTASRTGSMIDRLSAMLQTIPAWWDGFAHARPRHGAVHVAALAAALLAAAAFCRGGALRLAIALLAASGGLAAATFYHLGGMAPTGEGGRLLYGPIAWLALALGVLLLHAPGARLPLRVARALAVLAIVAGAGLLHVMLREVAWVQENERAAVKAFAQWAAGHDSPVVAIVPENHGPIVVFRNALGGIVLPPVQERGMLHLIIPALPHDLPQRYAELARGLGTRLGKVVPQRADAAMLREIHEPDVPIWTDVICWNPRERRLLALPTADHATAEAWLRQTRTAARACLPDEPSFVSP